MAKIAKDTMWIAFPNGGILPSSETKGAERPIAAHEAVEVSAAYGDQLVEDRFAYATEPPKSKAKSSAEQPAT